MEKDNKTSGTLADFPKEPRIEQWNDKTIYIEDIGGNCSYIQGKFLRDVIRKLVKMNNNDLSTNDEITIVNKKEYELLKEALNLVLQIYEEDSLAPHRNETDGEMFDSSARMFVLLEKFEQDIPEEDLKDAKQHLLDVGE